jgi:hypothetical protein
VTPPARRKVKVATEDHPRAPRRRRHARGWDPQVAQDPHRLATEVERVRALVEPVAVAVIGRGPPSETPPAFVDHDRTTRSGNQCGGSQTTQTTADDMNLCIFHTHTTTSAPQM